MPTKLLCYSASRINVSFAEIRITPEQQRLVLGRKSITGSLIPRLIDQNP
jgi:hypothetical protein